MKVLVIGGGTSNEREVSLRSSKAVFEAALQKGHQAELYDWDGSEDWLKEHAAEFEAVLPILHGAGGEDGVIQQLLESLGVAYLGSNSKASQLCFHKQQTLDLLTSHGITVPGGGIVTLDQYQQSELFNKPHVLKPVDSGSSVDTFIYPDASVKDLEAIKAVFARYKTLLLEEYVSGTEVTVPVLDGKQLPIIEIVPPESGVFDYENKYNGQTKELVPPENVAVDLQTQLHELGQLVHQLTGCRHLSRVDMIIGENNQPYVLEVNTMPGMTDQSLFPKAAAAAGLDFPDFVDYLITITTQAAANV